MSSHDERQIEKTELEHKLEENFPLHERLRLAVVAVLNEVLSGAEIEYLPILSRTKKVDSALRKHRTKKYSNPIKMMTDLVGARIVLLLESDIERVTSLLRDSFEVDEKNSIDKRKSLKNNEFGYASVHLVCSLGKRRQSLPEYANLCGIKYEIQIRSALQHTWAEIEHKRNYKGHSALPPDLSRRLNAAAASLELVDRELSEIARQASHYSAKVAKNDTSVQGDPITVAGLVSIFKRTFGRASKSSGFPVYKSIAELNNFGVDTIRDLEKLLESDHSKAMISLAKNDDTNDNTAGFITDILLVNDVERYFLKSYRSDWHGIAKSHLNNLKSSSKKSDFEVILNQNKIFTYG